MACISTKRRLVEDKAYAEKNRQQAKINGGQKLCRKKNRLQAKINTKRQLMADKSYAEKTDCRLQLTRNAV